MMSRKKKIKIIISIAIRPGLPTGYPKATL
jgi:hypothetical protein